MRLNINKKTAAFATAGIGIPLVATAANFAEIASLFSDLKLQALSEFVAAGPEPATLAALALLTSGTVLGGVTGYLRSQAVARRKSHLLAEAGHDFHGQLRTDLEHLRVRLAHGDLTREELCRHFKQTMHACATNLDKIASLAMGRTCKVAIYVLGESGNLQSEHRSFASNRERYNYFSEKWQLSTGMKKILAKKEFESPIHIADNLSSASADWQDPSSDHHINFYRSCATIGIQYRPEHDYAEGTFFPNGTHRRVLAGFLQVENTGRRFRSQQIIETMAGKADALFSAVATFSQAEQHITGDHASSLTWILRSMTDRRADDGADPDAT